MKDPDRNKSEAIRAAIRGAKRPLRIDELIPRMERRLKMIVSKARLYTLLSVMQNAGELVSAGRGAARTYDLAR
jgi:hypothetical protein